MVTSPAGPRHPNRHRRDRVDGVDGCATTIRHRRAADPRATPLHLPQRRAAPAWCRRSSACAERRRGRGRRDQRRRRLGRRDQRLRTWGRRAPGSAQPTQRWAARAPWGCPSPPGGLDRATGATRPPTGRASGPPAWMRCPTWDGPLVARAERRGRTAQRAVGALSGRRRRVFSWWWPTSRPPVRCRPPAVANTMLRQIRSTSTRAPLVVRSPGSAVGTEDMTSGSLPAPRLSGRHPARSAHSAPGFS